MIPLIASCGAARRPRLLRRQSWRSWGLFALLLVLALFGAVSSFGVAQLEEHSAPVAGASPKPTTESRPLRLYTWNVWGSLDSATREVIDNWAADVVLLNDQRSVIEHWRWVREQSPAFDWHVAEFSCVSFGPRLELVSVLEHPNYRAPVMHLSLQEAGVGVDVFVFHAHTPVGSAEQHIEYLSEPDALLSDIAELTGHRRSIVAGDFNSPSPWDGPAPFVYSTQRFLEQGYVDAYAALHTAPREFTKLAGNNAGRRIDHFLVSRDLMPAVVDAGVDTATGFPEHSDHRPIWLELDLGRLATE